MNNSIRYRSRGEILALLWSAGVLLLAIGCNTSIPTPVPTITPTLEPTTLPSATPSTLPTTIPQPTATRLPTPTPIPPDVLGKLERNVTYCTANGTALKLDLYYPKKSNGSALPVAINVHGGSWRAGDKSRSDSAADIPLLLERGYLVAAVNYRFAPADKFPAQIEDVKCAVRFLRANAATYQLDPNRIGAWGCSAGGHLVALLGVTDPSARFEGTGGYPEQSSRVRAVAMLSAPTDLTLYDAVARADMLEQVFGATKIGDPLLVRASPITYVTKNAAPFLIVQAEKDNMVSARHGEKLFERLNGVGVPAKLVTVKNGDHCLLSGDLPLTPTRGEVSNLIADFFDAHMR